MKKSEPAVAYAVIFDMDGVIVHTNPYHAQAFSAFFKKYALTFDEADFAEHMYGKHNSYIMSHFFGRTIIGEELKHLEEEKEALFREIYKDRVKAIAGFENFLDQLIKADLSCGVATSAPRANLDLIAEPLHLRKYMKSLLASEDVLQHKPNPEVYLKSAKNLGVPPTNCLVFEDSFSGVTAAKNAGARVVGVLSSHSKSELPTCNHYIYDYHEITTEIVWDILKS